jgi:gliding motility associated protien GldN
MKKIFISCVLVLLSVSVWAQTTKPNTTKKPLAKTEPIPAPVVIPPPPPPAPVPATKQKDRPVDGYYKKVSIPQAEVMPLATIREADIIFSKRVWREIDVREKMNQFFVAPQSSLIEIIRRAVEAGELTAYDPTPAQEKDDLKGDAFSTVLDSKKAAELFRPTRIEKLYDDLGDVRKDTVITVDFVPERYNEYNFRIKEDWIFDKQRSVFEPRIVGIAVLKKKIVDGEDEGSSILFWLYFPELRNILVKTPVVNSHNDAASLSYDDVFMKRIFSSYIVKVSNVKDEFIRDYITTSGVDRLKESERLKKELLDWEHDLWSY